MFSKVLEVYANLIKNLDCAHVMTAPGLAWVACLKMCNQPPELLTDIDMHVFIGRGIRGGIAMISKRWAVANNKYVEQYDDTKPSNYIIYLNSNNLYWKCMVEPVPYGSFERVDAKDISENQIFSLPDDSPEGMILEVDLSVPQHLHDFF